jgi:GMP synthase-like glutamine amidotransferase
MRVLVIENFHHTGLGQVGTALAEAGAAIDLRRPHLGEALPAGTEGFDGLVVLGGGQNARDDGAHPYFPELLSLMRQFADGGKAVLGICLGCQLLARAYGADNLIGAAPEFGWGEVALTHAGRSDPLLSHVPASFITFQWHDDTFTLPDGAVRLAENEAAANQAFRIGRAAYGIQFHFEADREVVRYWNSAFANWLAERQPGWSGRMEDEAALYGAQADAAGLSLARAWVASIGTH